MTELTPVVTLSGAKKNKIILNLPYNLPGGESTDPAYYYNCKEQEKFLFTHICLIIDGFNAQNMASFQ
jgi:hypothetical protein